MATDRRAQNRSMNIKNVKNAFVAITPIVLFLGCSNPADKVPAAAVRSASNNPAGEGKQAESGGRYFAFSPSSSTIDFVGSKVTRSHNGGFTNFAGKIQVANGKIAGSTEIKISTKSLWADDQRLALFAKEATASSSPRRAT